jgi:hypothetical protein
MIIFSGEVDPTIVSFFMGGEVDGLESFWFSGELRYLIVYLRFTQFFSLNLKSTIEIKKKQTKNTNGDFLGAVLMFSILSFYPYRATIILIWASFWVV